MTSLVGGNNILHIANRLTDLKKDQAAGLACSYQTSPSSYEAASAFDTGSPPFETNSVDRSPTRAINFFPGGDALRRSIAEPTSTTAHSDTTTTNSDDPMGGGGRELSESPDLPTRHGGILSAIQQLQDRQQRQFNFAFLSSFGEPPNCAPDDVQDQQKSSKMPATIGLSNQVASNSPSSHISTVRDMIPTYSPWMRNAGRKKSHPVWEFFRDLKETTGAGGVMCLHCAWQGDDRSPNNLRTHLKKFHTDDGIFARFSLRLAQTPTQPYVKRTRGCNGSTSQNERAPPPLESVAFAMQQLQQSGQLSSYNASLNFLENLPKSNEIINISAGFMKKGDDNESSENHSNEAGSSSASEERAVANSPMNDLFEQSRGSPQVSNGRSMNSESNSSQLAALMNMAVNPMMIAMLGSAANAAAAAAAVATSNASSTAATTTSTSVASIESSSSPPTTTADGCQAAPFSLNDGHCTAILMSMALDLDMTMSYHRRRADVEMCFESNRTAEKSGGRGKIICLIDMGKEIRIVERVNSATIDTEMWTKTDFNQFHWAIRGKCQKAFNKS